jgi:thiol-disulfide isomerase/thioredoxin
VSKKKHRKSRRPSERTVVPAAKSSARAYAIGLLAVLAVLIALVGMKQLSVDRKPSENRNLAVPAPLQQPTAQAAADAIAPHSEQQRAKLEETAAQTVGSHSEQPIKTGASAPQPPVTNAVQVAIPSPKSELERIAQSAALATAARIASRGTAAHAGFPLPSLQGLMLGPANYPGKVVVVNFWATWCGPCKKEIPDLLDLYADYHGRGVEILGVSLDGSADVVRSYAESTAINYVILIGNAEVGRQYEVTAIPTTLLFDRDGKIVKRLVGTQSRDSLEAAIKSLL